MTGINFEFDYSLESTYWNDTRFRLYKIFQLLYYDVIFCTGFTLAATPSINANVNNQHNGYDYKTNLLECQHTSMKKSGWRNFVTCLIQFLFHQFLSHGSTVVLTVFHVFCQWREGLNVMLMEDYGTDICSGSVILNINSGNNFRNG